MKLSDFVSVECVVVPLRARTLAEASEALVQCIEASAAIRDAGRLRRRIDESRNEDVVMIGGRAFLMHYRAEAVGALRVAIGVAAEPIVRGEEHGDQRARVVVLVVAPPREAARHLQLVRAFARLFARQEVVDSIHSAPDAAAVASIAALDEFTLPEELTVRDLMTERPRTTTPEMQLREAARSLMLPPSRLVAFGMLPFA